jgi:hypothetical protein
VVKKRGRRKGGSAISADPVVNEGNKDRGGCVEGK